MGVWEAVKAVFGATQSDNRIRLLDQFQKTIDYRFRDIDLLQVALTHRSFAKSGEKDWIPSNERLEFLGDSVLGLIVADILYNNYPNELEGGLTKLKSLLVNEITLFRTAQQLDLGRYVLLSPEEDRAGGRNRPSINADTLEAIIGAMYLDGGPLAVRKLIERFLYSQIDSITADTTFRNFKGDLLEYLQGRGLGMPRYEVISEKGPDHDKTFTVVVYSNGEIIGRGGGNSKKDAEQQAAGQALKILKVE
ncbi:MAG: ribonuclease III [FCB group bacterium]|nr:ribonuclease III [FCB group bacterium]